MLAILSPAKTLITKHRRDEAQQPADLWKGSNQLIKDSMSIWAFRGPSLMKISDKLADLNHKRYVKWRKKTNEMSASDFGL